MILNRQISHAIRVQLYWLNRMAMRFSVVLMISACSGGVAVDGGGVGGSGDGGKDTALPIGFEAAYEFRHVPQNMLARFPTSLVSDHAATQDGTQSPLNILTSSVDELIDRKIEIGLLQLHLEANWTNLVQHCSTIADDTNCDLTGADISETYTAAMASWEFLLRTNIEIEQSGSTALLTDEKRTSIENLVSAKIGSPLRLNDGYFQRSPSRDYQYEVILTADIGFGKTIYTTRWSQSKQLTFISLTKIVQGAREVVVNLQSSTNSMEIANGVRNSILLTDYTDGAKPIRQLSLNLLQPLDSTDLGVEMLSTRLLEASKIDHYSIGNATNLGGYLRSEQSSKDVSDTKEFNVVRESFVKNATLESDSICRGRQTEQQCDQEQSWELGAGGDPSMSTYFLSSTELEEIEERLVPYDLDIQGVSPELEAIVLIRRENLSITLSDENGVILSLPGLGTIDLIDNELIPEGDITAENNEFFNEYKDSVLCRINTLRTDEQVEYRSFCAEDSEAIENALVVGESLRGGNFLIEWQANATVKILEN